MLSAICCFPVWIIHPMPWTARTYPVGFGHGLRQIMTSWQAEPHLRQKQPVNVNMSDREIFSSLPLGDTWPDAELVQVYKYLRQSDKTHVPESWHDVFTQLDSQLDNQ